MNKENKGNLKMSGERHYKEQWLKNPTFEDPIEPTWFSTIEGDNSDVNATSGSGQANFVILGESNEIRFDEPFVGGNWEAKKNPEIPMLPDIYEINSSGCYASHQLDEMIDATRFYSSIHWKKNFTMPVNMLDYTITSASLKVVYNASVIVDPHDGGGIDCSGDPGIDMFAIGDFASFYVLISDLENDFSIQLAHYQTRDLGRDDPYTSNITDTLLNTVPNQALIDLITAVLEKDHSNFTITLGIDMYCEDNEMGVDRDYWKSLIIKSFNLTLTYKKKMNPLTSASWVQVGNQLRGDNLQITNARLNFMYKIDQLWPETPKNSEIRIVINEMLHTETIKLSKINTVFQELKFGGFNVTNLIEKDLNISLSIQFYFAEVFVLDYVYNISIDNVFLEISYKIQADPVSDDGLILTLINIMVISVAFFVTLLISLYVVKPRIQKRSIIKKNTNKAKREIKNFEYDLRNLIRSKLVDYYDIENWEQAIPFYILTEIQKKTKKDRSKLTIDAIKVLSLDQLLTIILEENNWENIFSEIFKDKQTIMEKFENLRTYKNDLYQGILDLEELDKYLILIQAIKSFFIRGLNVFFSYSILDTTYYKIAEIAQRLEDYSDIENIFYWEAEGGDNILKYKEECMQICNVFVLFCSANSLKSKSVEDEWQAAFQLRKKRTLKMIPVCENEAELPLLLGHILYVRFDRDDIERFVEQLYKEILRGV
jgi:hypothetical protein